jgi:hypothetical protein
VAFGKLPIDNIKLDPATGGSCAKLLSFKLKDNEKFKIPGIINNPYTFFLFYSVGAREKYHWYKRHPVCDEWREF